VARVLADRGADLFAAFRATITAMGANLALDESVCTLIARAGLFVRQYDRLRLAQAIADAGAPCTIFGRVWRDRLGERPHLTFHDEIDVAEMNRAYGQARVVFNLNAANGGSERVTHAMAAGAVVASDYSPLLESSFARRRAITFYDRRDMSGVAEALALSGDVQQQMAERGHETVAAGHLWSHRAAELVAMLRAAPFRIDLLQRPVGAALSG
jgi:spore maturation protein CgeB